MIDTSVDMVVIGAGPAGLSAAIEARSLGLSVVLLDEQPTLGGQIYRNVETAPPDRLDILGKDYAAGRALADAFKSSGAIHIGGASVWNVTPEGAVDYILDGKARQATGKSVVIAGGAMERPFPIKGWTLPGVMGAGAAQILLKNSGALPNGPMVLAGCGPLLYLLAWQYLRAGVRIAALVDTTSFSAHLRAAPHILGALMGWRDLVKGIKLLATIRRLGVPVYSAASDLAIEGEAHVTAIAFKAGGQTASIPASLVLLHHGVVPNTQLSWSLRAKHRWDHSQLCWQPVTDQWGRLEGTEVYVAGDSRAIVGAKASAVQGRLAALGVAQSLGKTPSPGRVKTLRRQLGSATRIRRFLDTLYRPATENRIPPVEDVIVCRCEEVTAGQIRKIVSLGCLGPNQTKAFGRCGMGPCQGRLCGLTVTELIASERGVDPAEVGYYRIRAPIKPVLLGDFVD